MKILMKAEKDKLDKEKEIIKAKMNQFPQNPFIDTFENEEELKNYINLIKENKKYFIEKLNEKITPVVKIGAISLIVFIASLLSNITLSLINSSCFWPLTSVSIVVFIFCLCYPEIKNTIKTDFYLKKLEAKLKDLDYSKNLPKTLEKDMQIDSEDTKKMDAYFEQVSNLIIVIQDLKYDGYLNDISKLFSLLDKYVNLKKIHNLDIHDLSLLNPKSEFIVELINIEQKLNGIKQNLDMQQSLEDLDD